jgi:hypothetical protein
MVSTFELSIGPAHTVNGVGVACHVEIYPSVKMIQEDDGSVISILPVSFDVDAGETGTVNLPHTNQLGFVDVAGTELTEWYYRVEVDESIGETKAGYHYRKFVQASVGTDALDLDEIPEDGANPDIVVGAKVSIATKGSKGDTGDPGPIGPIGPTGPMGPQGLQGTQGAQGIQGVQGTPGTNGTNGATWRQGSAVPANTLGVDNDFYFRTTTSDVYQRISGVYSIIANIKGATGAAGTNGTNGATWRTGSGVPSNALGVDGDLYLNTATSDVYLRTSGTYAITANIKGATGATGTNGTNGTNGATWRTGSGTPSNGTGVDGDLYLNTTTSDVYQRASGTYSVIANIKGATGAAGAGAILAAVYPTPTTQATIGATDVDVTGMTATVTVGASGQIRVAFQMHMFSSTTDVVRVRLKDGSTTIREWLRSANSVGTNTNITSDFEAFVNGITPGSHTYKISIAALTNTNLSVAPVAASPNWLVIQQY